MLLIQLQGCLELFSHFVRHILNKLQMKVYKIKKKTEESSKQGARGGKKTWFFFYSA